MNTALLHNSTDPKGPNIFVEFSGHVGRLDVRFYPRGEKDRSTGRLWYAYISEEIFAIAGPLDGSLLDELRKIHRELRAEIDALVAEAIA